MRNEGEGALKSVCAPRSRRLGVGFVGAMAGWASSTFGDVQSADQEDQPQCFVAYTIKGFGMPLQGHKDNHAGLMSPEQMAELNSLRERSANAERLSMELTATQQQNALQVITM